MKIAICDDNKEDLLKIEELLLQYREKNPGLELTVEKYSDAVSLCRRIREKDSADFYILDLLMDGMSGIDLGREIRRSGSDSEIVYITSSDDFALDAYGVHAARYLLKPVRDADFFEALDHGFSRDRAREEACFLVKTRDGLASAAYSQIEYVENASRTLMVCLAGGGSIQSIFIRKSFDDETGNLLSDRCFVQVHKSFVINLKYVKRLGQSVVVMESGREIPVSKSRIAEVKREYLAYVLERYA